MSDDAPRKRSFGLGGFTVSYIPKRQPANHPDYLPARVALLVGTFMTFSHDLAYRQTDGSDFELGGVLSHAGADMLFLVTLPITFFLGLLARRRAR